MNELALKKRPWLSSAVWLVCSIISIIAIGYVDYIELQTVSPAYLPKLVLILSIPATCILIIFLGLLCEQPKNWKLWVYTTLNVFVIVLILFMPWTIYQAK